MSGTHFKNIRTRFLWLFFVTFIVCPLVAGAETGHQSPDLVGPLLVSTRVGGLWITLYDVGSGRTVELERAEDSFYAEEWSPDGCRILIREHGGRWSVLDIEGFNVHPIPISGLPPAWTVSGDALTFSEYSQDVDSTSFFNFDILSESAQFLFSVNGAAGPDKWLSGTELLYVGDEGLWFVWDQANQESRPFPPHNQLSSYDDLHRRSYFMEVFSPDRNAIARFFNQRWYYDAYFNPFLASDDDEEAEIDVQPLEQPPGFEIFYPDTGVTEQVSMEGLFLQSLEWSPSGTQVLVSTYPFTTSEELNGIYIYNLESEELRKIGDFQAVFDTEYGPYVPTWSADEEWIALMASQGHIIYNLLDGQIIELNEQFGHFDLRLSWSPIMDYTTSPCRNKSIQSNFEMDSVASP